jgi:nondiscriminating aspartyl-tRNA synthetase
MKLVAEFVGEPVEMEKPEVVLEKYGIKVGGVPPFGRFMGIKVLVDEGINRATNVTFSAGESTISVTMGRDDFVEILDGVVGMWGKE